MEGLLLIPMGLLWLAWGYWFGRWAYSWKRNRWHQVLATVFALWLPLWDLIPGYLLYQRAIREVGGIRIYRTVEAEGYLDRMAVLGSCWKSLKDSPYSYCENYERENSYSSLGSLNSRAGYYEYRLARIDSPECFPFHQLNIEAMQKSYQLDDRCVVATRRDEPVSRYEFAMGQDLYEGVWPVPPAKLGWMRVVDRHTGEVVAEATSVVYRIWMMRTNLGIPLGWGHTQDEAGRPIELRLGEILRTSK